MDPTQLLMMGPLGSLVADQLGAGNMLNPFQNATGILGMSPGFQMLANSPVGDKLDLPKYMSGESDPIHMLMEKMAKRQTGNFQI